MVYTGQGSLAGQNISNEMHFEKLLIKACCSTMFPKTSRAALLTFDQLSHTDGQGQDRVGQAGKTQWYPVNRIKNQKGGKTQRQEADTDIRQEKRHTVTKGEISILVWVN